jgi:hypothetical protein
MEATDGGQSEQAGALRAAQQGGHRTVHSAGRRRARIQCM